MPRGRKSYTLDEQLNKVTNEIEIMENELKKMKQLRVELEQQIRQNKLAELDQLMSSKGLSFEDLKEMLIAG